MLSSNEHPFRGNYNGGGNMLAFFESGVPDEFAPFCDIDGATIRNLYITGIIETKNRWAAGLAVDAFGTCLIQNCRCDVKISSDNSSAKNCDGTHSAFISVSQKQSDMTFEGCVVDGRFLGAGVTNYCGGWTMVKADSLSYADVFDSLKRGEVYASWGRRSTTSSMIRTA